MSIDPQHHENSTPEGDNNSNIISTNNNCNNDNEPTGENENTKEDSSMVDNIDRSESNNGQSSLPISDDAIQQIATDNLEEEEKVPTPPSSNTASGKNNTHEMIMKVNVKEVTISSKVPTPPSSNKSIGSTTNNTKQAVSNNMMATRSRTRSMSSTAVSSLSGGEGGEGSSITDNKQIGTIGNDINLASTTAGGDVNPASTSAANTAVAYDFNDGKTPIRANMGGPMRKRHKKRVQQQKERVKNGGAHRRLFNKNEEQRPVGELADPPLKQEELKDGNNNIADATSGCGQSSSLLPPLNESGLLTTSVSFASAVEVEGRRERSNTIESFRAAMDYNTNNDDNLLDESTLPAPELLPDMKQDPPSSPSQRKRSDTIDFLTSHVDFQMNDNEDGGPTVGGGIDSSMNVINEPKPVNGEGLLNDKKKEKGICAYGKTPKKTNRTRGASHSSTEMSLTSQGPLRKRYRTRSLSFAKKHQQNDDEGEGEGERKNNLDEEEEATKRKSSVDNTNNDDDDDIANHESDNNSAAGNRHRSNTLDLFRTRSDTFDNIMGGGGGRRERSDTLDFLTAVVAGDMGHDLDAAIAAAADDGASFAMHAISAPSGASSKYNSMSKSRQQQQQQQRSRSDTFGSSSTAGGRNQQQQQQQQRPRSDTLDSTASSINSAKLDFFVQVAEAQGVLNSPVPVGGGLAGSLGLGRSSLAGSENSADQQQQQQNLLTQHVRRPRSNTLEIYSNMNAAVRTRSDTVDFLMGTNSDIDQVGNIELPSDNLGDGYDNNNIGDAMDHLKADHVDNDESKITGETKTARILRRKRMSPTRGSEGELLNSTTSALNNKKQRKNSETTWKSNVSSHETTNSLMNSLNNRNRLESWGGMSDLSVGGIAAQHTALKDTGILDDVMAAAADLEGDDLSSAASSLERMRTRALSGGSNSVSGVGTAGAATTAQQKGRPRKNSLASLSLASLSDASISASGSKNKSKAQSGGTTPTMKASSKKSPSTNKPSDTASTSTPSIIVDYDAIASAVLAANLATDGLDLSAILGTPSTSKSSGDGSNKPPPVVVATKQSCKKSARKTAEKRKLPPKSNLPKAPSLQPAKTKPLPPIGGVPQSNTTAGSTKPPLVASMPPLKSTPQLLVPKDKSPQPFPVTSINIPLVPIPKSNKSKEEMEAIKERARAAAGYIPPAPGSKKPEQRRPPPPRQMPTKPPNLPDTYLKNLLNPTTVQVPIKKRPPPSNLPVPEHVQSQTLSQPPPLKQAPAMSMRRTTGTVQSQQKWEQMFDCLVQFIEDTREKSTRHMTEEQKAQWVWDGNVPTSYKTPCGKALGRWINNQRSAKSKGSLKDDREVRLVSTGLKWSVITTNSWMQMLEQLKLYAHNQSIKHGRPWDGNVPTNYKIRIPLPPSAGVGEEEKNLGRWVNRQRCLYQAGKLKKERQDDLNRIGLRWSVLSNAAWPSMYQSLCRYAEQRRKQSPNGWDGNVPANFKTQENPSHNLGRWVNKQRSAYANGRLKDEYVRKLESIGLKWQSGNTSDEEYNYNEDDSTGGEPEMVQSNTAIVVPNATMNVDDLPLLDNAVEGISMEGAHTEV